MHLAHEEQAADTSQRNRALHEDTASIGQRRHREGRATPRPATHLRQRDQIAVEGTTIPSRPGRGRRPTGQPDRAEEGVKRLEEGIDPPWREVTAGRRSRCQLGHQRLAADHPPSHKPKTTPSRRKCRSTVAAQPKGCGFSPGSRGGRRGGRWTSKSPSGRGAAPGAPPMMWPPLPAKRLPRSRAPHPTTTTPSTGSGQTGCRRGRNTCQRRRLQIWRGRPRGADNQPLGSTAGPPPTRLGRGGPPTRGFLSSLNCL